MAQNTSQTLINLRKSSEGLDENMTALQENFLFVDISDVKPEGKRKADEKGNRGSD
jgi:hypothetical protein